MDAEAARRADSGASHFWNADRLGARRWVKDRRVPDGSEAVQSMSDQDPDLDNDDQLLARLTRGELVALLNRLYVRLGETPVAASTALASTDDELRDSIGVVRRRLATKLGAAREVLAPARRPRRGARDLARGGADDGAHVPDRVFAVLFASDRNFVASARVACRERGVTLVSIPSVDMLVAVVASVTPTHVVIVGEGFEPDDLAASTIVARDLEQRGVRVRLCAGHDDAIQALAEIDS